MSINFPQCKIVFPTLALLFSCRSSGLVTCGSGIGRKKRVALSSNLANDFPSSFRTSCAGLLTARALLLLGGVLPSGFPIFAFTSTSPETNVRNKSVQVHWFSCNSAQSPFTFTIIQI